MIRVFDLCIASLILLLTAPIMIIVALLIRIKLGSPILFKQVRPGLNEKPFMLYKFRSMTKQLNLPEEQRLTTFGNWLRKYSLDELPQLLNVLKGELSLVGPRPLLMEYLPLYSQQQARRHLVKPGITGWAQVNGRNAITWQQKFEFDVWYVDNQSLRLNLKILCLTAKKLFKAEGISQRGYVSMAKFTGTENE